VREDNYQHHVHAGLDYIVTGGAGAPLYQIDPTPETLIKGTVSDNYVRVRVNRTTAQLEVVDLEGKVLDSFEVKARPKAAQIERATWGHAAFPVCHGHLSAKPGNAECPLSP
jgi:hypothetical protein